MENREIALWGPREQSARGGGKGVVFAQVDLWIEAFPYFTGDCGLISYNIILIIG
jgi:hypothetical protein